MGELSVVIVTVIGPTALSGSLTQLLSQAKHLIQKSVKKSSAPVTVCLLYGFVR
eukprot:m.35061 g.35061  ORF g.35061 m.35061 type:complete len:54 (+) comp10889_c0_seq2:51-212(+)